MEHASKFKLRKHFRDVRSHMKPVTRHDDAVAAANILFNLPVFNNSRHIACYLSFKDEFDSAAIIETIWNAKKVCYIPILAEKNKDQNYLRFVRYEYGDPLHMNRYGILEPVNLAHEIQPENLELVIMPLLAFDHQGHRLGTGGGYYDRTFEFLHGVSNGKLRLLGLGYTAQQAELIPDDPWDLRLDGVITEKEFIRCA